MFTDLQAINTRPGAFARMTISDLWTDPYISEQMLRFHLDESVAMSSDTTENIEAAVAWMTATFGLAAGSRVLDLGCGPGLYTTRLARAGAGVKGVDFSARSIAHARQTAVAEGLDIEYLNADYLAWEPDGRYDLVTMIMRDFCALSPEGRGILLGKVAALLEPGGKFLFDVDSMAAMKDSAEAVSYSVSEGNGFFSPEPYFEFHNWFRYPDESASLDKIVIVEADRTRTLYNWIQYFSPERLSEELAAAGLEVETILGDVRGRPYDAGSHQFAVVVRLGRATATATATASVTA